MGKKLFTPRRAVEASPNQMMAVGAYAGGVGGIDPIDGDRGYARMGGTQREVPGWTREKARAASIAAYRINPMARAVIDTMTAFCVGDSGLSLQISSDAVREVAEEFWNDPENQLYNQELFLRDALIMGEQCFEFMEGEESGCIRINPIDTTNIIAISLRQGNVLWPDKVHYQYGPNNVISKTLVRTNEDTKGLREGDAIFFAPWKTLLQDTRSTPFLMPILDQLDNYDQVITNLIDRTTLARYLVWDVSVDGTERDVREYVENRGTAMPKSGAIEFHNKKVEWKPMTVQTGAEEDSIANRTILTQIAGGSGISKPWLGEPEDANRATSLSMAEPVRRRVEGIQKVWMRFMTEIVRYAIDRAVAKNRIAATVTATNPRTGEEYEVPAALAVSIVGPEIAAADAQINAEILLNLAKGLESMVSTGVISHAASQVIARKAWEDYMGTPYTADLNDTEGEQKQLADYIADKLQQEIRADHQENPPADVVRGTTKNGSKPAGGISKRQAGKTTRPSDSNYSGERTPRR